MNTTNKTIYFPKTVDSGNITTEWEKEYELEGNMPDIQRLLRIDSTPQINGTEINKSGKIEVVTPWKWKVPHFIPFVRG